MYDNLMPSNDFRPETNGYRQGESFECAISQRTTGGYELALPSVALNEAFLPTRLALRDSEVVEVYYVGNIENRLIFSLSDREFEKRVRERAAYRKDLRITWMNAD